MSHTLPQQTITRAGIDYPSSSSCSGGPACRPGMAPDVASLARERTGPVPTRRPSRHRHRGLLGPRSCLRGGIGRGGRQRRARERAAPTSSPRRVRRWKRSAGSARRADGRRRPRGVSAARGRDDGGVRARGHPGQQRRRRHLVSGHPGDTGTVPAGDRHQPQRLLLDGAGLWSRDAARELDRQRQQCARDDHGWTSASRVLRQQGRFDRAHTGSRAAMDGPQGHPCQRARHRASSRRR